MAQFARPTSDIDTTGWTTTPLWSKLDEVAADDGDLVTSSNDPSSVDFEVALGTITDPALSTGHIMRVRHVMRYSGGGAPSDLDVTMRLVQGTTVIATTTYNHAANTQDTWVTTATTLTGGEADSITNYADLRIRVTVNKVSGARTNYGEVSWAELETPDVAADHELVIQEATHSHAADNAVLTQTHVLTTAESTHSHTADNVVLVVVGDEPTYIAKLAADNGGGTNNVSFTVPAGAQVDDLLLVSVVTASSGNTFSTLPNADWTQIGSLNRSATNPTSGEIAAWALVTSGGNVDASSSQTFTWSGSHNYVLRGVQLRGVDTTTPINAWGRGASNDDQTSLAVSTSSATTVNDVLLVGLGGADAGVTPPGWSTTESSTERWDEGNILSDDISVAGYTEPKAATGTYTFTFNLTSAEQILAGIYAIAPDAGTTQNLVIQESTHSHTADNAVLTQTHVLTTAEAAHAHSADNVDLTQTHILVTAEALHAHAADNVVLDLTVNLVIADATHAHTADNAVLTQTHVLLTADSTHAHAADNVDLDAEITLVVAEATHSHAADNVDLDAEITLAVQESTHAHTADNVDLDAEITLVVAEALHSHAADNLDLTQTHVLATAEALHGHTADNLVLTSGIDLVIQEAAHAHSADNAVLTQTHILVVQDATHAHTADNVTLDAEITLVVAEALHAHAADNVTLDAEITLVVAEATHAHAADNVDLDAEITLTVAEATHAHLADNVVLEVQGAINLVVQEALHAHAADNAALTQTHILVVQEATHAHSSDVVDLDAEITLVVAEATHAQAADGLTLAQIHALVVGDSAHALDSPTIALTQTHALVVQETLHAHAADNISLGQIGSDVTPTPGRTYSPVAAQRTITQPAARRTIVVPIEERTVIPA